MGIFFKHENHPYHPSLPGRGKLRLGKKSDLLACLEQTTQTEPPCSFGIKVLDVAAVLHLLSTRNVTTFGEYANDGFLPYITKQLESTKRIDVAWDTYLKSSIKESTREKRGKGIRRKVASQNRVPRNWRDFLRDPAHKQELLAL